MIETSIGQIRSTMKKCTRLIQLNCRSCMVFSIILFVIISAALVRFYQYDGAVSRDKSSSGMHMHKLTLSNSCRKALNGIAAADNGGIDEDDVVWSNETVELFQDQLGIVIESDNSAELISDNGDGENFKCHHRGREFIMSALPGPDGENDFYEALWQYFSLDAVEHMTAVCGRGGEKLTLRAVVTERMKVHLMKLFDGLPLEIISNFPPSCFDLKYTKIVGNVSPLDLTEIAVDTTFLLDPKAKRWTEIVQRWTPKLRPFWRLKAALLNEVQQEFMVAKAIQQIEPSRDNDVNFVGIYVRGDDKLPPDYYHRAMRLHRQNGGAHIFMIICDSQIFAFCRETFEREKKMRVNDTRIMRKSSDAFDFALMASCNATIVSNDMGLLHALMNGGFTVVFKPESKGDPLYYIPWLMSEKMHNWHVITNNTMQ